MKSEWVPQIGATVQLVSQPKNGVEFPVKLLGQVGVIFKATDNLFAINLPGADIWASADMMARVRTFTVTLIDPFWENDSDAEAAEGIRHCIQDAIGFPAILEIRPDLLKVEPCPPSPVVP